MRPKSIVRIQIVALHILRSVRSNKIPSLTFSTLMEKVSQQLNLDLIQCHSKMVAAINQLINEKKIVVTNAKYMRLKLRKIEI